MGSAVLWAHIHGFFRGQQILKGAKTVTIAGGSGGVGGSFSKAAFVTEGSDEVDINDPNFWQKHNFGFKHLSSDRHSRLIIHGKRKRRRINYGTLDWHRDRPEHLLGCAFQLTCFWFWLAWLPRASFLQRSPTTAACGTHTLMKTGLCPARRVKAKMPSSRQT